MGGGPTAEPSVVAPDIFGDDSSGFEGEGTGDGTASPSKDAKTDSVDRHRPVVAPTMEVSEDEAAYSLAAPFQSMAFRPVA
jgi:hypothetical protein